MSSAQRRLILLGPQPKYQSLQIALERLNIHGRVAIVTAGWEEDEARDQSLRQALSCDSVNLTLFKRSEQLFDGDAQLIQQLQARQDEVGGLRQALVVPGRGPRVGGTAPRRLCAFLRGAERRELR